MLPTKSMKMLPLAINIRPLLRGIDISQQIGALIAYSYSSFSTAKTSKVQFSSCSFLVEGFDP